MFVLSYIDTHEIRQLFSCWSIRKVTTQKHVSGFAEHRATISELLISNYRLGSLPNREGPGVYE